MVQLSEESHTHHQGPLAQDQKWLPGSAAQDAYNHPLSLVWHWIGFSFLKAAKIDHKQPQGQETWWFSGKSFSHEALLFST
jgi:hypothetical protein